MWTFISYPQDPKSHGWWGENLTFLGGYLWCGRMLMGLVKFLKSQSLIVLSVEPVAICCSYLLKSMVRISVYIKKQLLRERDGLKCLVWARYGPIIWVGHLLRKRQILSMRLDAIGPDYNFWCGLEEKRYFFLFRLTQNGEIHSCTLQWKEEF